MKYKLIEVCTEPNTPDFYWELYNYVKESIDGTYVDMNFGIFKVYRFDENLGLLISRRDNKCELIFEEIVPQILEYNTLSNFNKIVLQYKRDKKLKDLGYE